MIQETDCKSDIIRISNYLLLNSSFSDNIGLLNGKGAVVLFYAELFRHTGNDYWGELSFCYLEEIIGQINLYTPLTFGNGIAGIGVLLEYLSQSGLIEQNVDELLQESEPYLLSAVYGAKLGHIGISQGISGIGLYLLSRLNAGKPAHHIHQLRLKECLIACVDQVYHLLGGDKEITGMDNLSIQEGISGTLLFLHKVHEFGCYPALSNQLIHHIIEYLLNNLKNASFSWTHIQPIAALLEVTSTPSFAMFHDHIKALLGKFINTASANLDTLLFTEAVAVEMWTAVIAESTPLSGEVHTLNILVSEFIQHIIKSNSLTALYGYSAKEHAVPTGLDRGICALGLPLLAKEARYYTWLSVLGINGSKKKYHEN